MTNFADGGGYQTFPGVAMGILRSTGNNQTGEGGAKNSDRHAALVKKRAKD